MDYVTLANLALAMAGEGDRISSPNDSGRAAEAIRDHWDTARRSVLGMADWKFATRTVQLAARLAHSEYPLAQFSAAFPLAPAMVRFIELVAPDTGADGFSQEAGPNGEEIQLDFDGPITVRGVYDLEDPSRWPQDFCDTFVPYLAFLIGDPIGGDQKRASKALKVHEDKLKLAKKQNTRRSPRRAHATTPWTAARFAGTNRAPGV